jgi:hypothetical protein
MTKEITEKFFKRFDFFHPEKPMTEALMCFGFECSDGWQHILWRLCEQIEIELDKDPELKKDFEVVQVKEKFGGLRFYTNTGNDAIYELISEVENLSYTICEVCGEPATLTENNRWYRTICETCNKKGNK